MRYVSGTDEQGGKIDIRDPLATRLTAIAKASGADPQDLVDDLLAVREVFGEDLPRHESFRAELARHLTSLRQLGARDAARNLIGAGN
jgi:fructuronate reductase